MNEKRIEMLQEDCNEYCKRIEQLEEELAECKRDAECNLAAIIEYGKAVKLHESRVRDPNFNWDDKEAVDYIDHELVMAGLELEKIAAIADMGKKK